MTTYSDFTPVHSIDIKQNADVNLTTIQEIATSLHQFVLADACGHFGEITDRAHMFYRVDSNIHIFL